MANKIHTCTILPNILVNTHQFSPKSPHTNASIIHTFCHVSLKRLCEKSELWSLNIPPVSPGLVAHNGSVKPRTPYSDGCSQQLYKTLTLWTLKKIPYVLLLHFPISSKLRDIEIMNLSNEQSQTGTAKNDRQLRHAHYSNTHIFFSQAFRSVSSNE